MPAAVATCTRAGILVRMVTGDNVHTAKHIARECGILTDDGIALEGPVFRRMSEAELIPMLPKLQVRCALYNSVPCSSTHSNASPHYQEANLGKKKPITPSTPPTRNMR